MVSFSNRPMLSSIHIEPVDSDEYNRSLVEQLTPYHKQKFLQFLKERDFFNASFAHSELDESVVAKLNKHKPKCSRTEWLEIFKAWMDSVSKSRANQRSEEDQELLEYKCRHQSKTTPESLQTSLRKSYSKAIESLSTHCRICLASSSSKMLHLFIDESTSHQSVGEISLLDKLNYCACFASEACIDDHLPQYICMSCSILVENAYQLKILCAKTENKFKELSQNHSEDSDVEIGNTTRNTTFTISNVQIDTLDFTEISNLNENIESEEIELKPIKDEGERERELETDAANEVIQIITVEKCNVIQRKSYQCAHCEKWFQTNNSLTIHVRTHTGERPYSCEVCGKAFKTSSAINNHRAVHTDTKDFKCSTCDFSTNTKANLRIHERKHSGIQAYTCQCCSMKFRTSSNLVKHMRNIHERQKANKCDKCDRSFFSRESLRKHSISHTGLKPFVCPQKGCSLAYGWYNGLKKHIRHQHANEYVKLASEKYFFDKIRNVLPV